MSKHNYRIISKRRFLAFLICLILAFSTVIVSGLSVNAKSAEEYKFISVYVEKGDSLWSLSKKFNNTDLNIRDYIENVVHINKLGKVSLQPGQLLSLPIKE